MTYEMVGNELCIFNLCLLNIYGNPKLYLKGQYHEIFDPRFFLFVTVPLVP
jgi:hypothetical protein